MNKIIVILLLMVLLLSSCGILQEGIQAFHTASPDSGVVESQTETSILACENLFGFWDGLGEDESDTEQTSLPPMLQHVPREISNVQKWELVDWDSPDLDIMNLDPLLILIDPKFVPETKSVVVIDDRNEQENTYEPEFSMELTDQINTGDLINMNMSPDGEDVVLCIFRGQKSTRLCEYNFALQKDPSLVIDSWQNLAYLFTVNPKNGESIYLGYAEGSEVGCPSRVELGDNIVGSIVESEQILNIWRKNINVTSGFENEDSTLLGQHLMVFFFAGNSPYLLLVGSENMSGILTPVLIIPSEVVGNLSYLEVGLTDGDLFDFISIQKIEIISISDWLQNYTETLTFYTLENPNQLNNRTGKDFVFIGEPTVIMEEGNTRLDPGLGLAEPAGLQEPDLIIQVP